MNLTFLLINFLFIIIFDANTPYVEVENLFLKKEVEKIAKIGSDNIVISLFGNEKIYSNSQAKLVLKDFFKQYNYQNFKFVFKSKENATENYAIANYFSKTESIRLTFYFNKTPNQHKITKIIFEKD
jgi:hypothetical protein